MNYTDLLYNYIRDDYNTFINHQFYIELASGELNKEVFKMYLIQDAYYLVDYARTLCLLAEKAPTHDIMLLLLKFSLEGLEIEKELHNGLFKKFEINEQYEYFTGCSQYGEYLRNTIKNESFQIGLAAFLPCFWIYGLNSKNIYNKADLNTNIYADWIATYSNEQFEKTINALKELLNKIAEKSDSVLKLQMREAFAISVKYEILFVDTIWNYFQK